MYIYIHMTLRVYICIMIYIYAPPPVPTFSLCWQCGFHQMSALLWIDDVEVYRRRKRTCMEDGMARKVSIFSLIIIQAKADRRWTWSLGLTRKICRSAKWTMCCTDFLLADDLQTIRSIWTWTIGPRCPNGSRDPYPLASTRTGLSAISCANACCRRDKTGWLPICL